MKKTYFFWVLLIILLFFTITLIGLNIIKKEQAYVILERDLVETAYAYLNVNKIKLMNNEKLKIEYEELLTVASKEEFKVNNDYCKGYVIVTRKNSKYNSNAYIKCQNYTTVGYE